MKLLIARSRWSPSPALRTRRSTRRATACRCRRSTKQVKAEYTPEAMQNRIEGKVGLDAVVLADGKVGDVTVTESLDTIYGLDKNAVAAMKQWEFKPGMKDGKPVAVRIHVLINFTLK